MATSTVRLHRVLRYARQGLSGISRSRCHGQMASAAWLCRPRLPSEAGVAAPGCIVHQLLQRPKPLLWRQIPPTAAQRTHPPHRRLRRRQPAGRNGNDHLDQAGLLRRRTGHRATRHPRSHLRPKPAISGWQESLTCWRNWLRLKFRAEVSVWISMKMAPG